MFQQLLRKGRRQDGFTLIELIVVVAILGILAAVLTPRVLEAVDDARVSAAESSARQIQLAMERYMIANDWYPDDDVLEDTGELVDLLAPYTVIDPASLSDDGFDYVPYIDADNDGVDEGGEEVETGARSFALTLIFTEGDVTFRITPRGLEHVE